jgi:hypothetical protein
VLDQAARLLLAQLVQSAVAAGSAAMVWQPQAAAPPAVPRLLDMMLLTSEQKFMDPGGLLLRPATLQLRPTPQLR